MWIVVYKPLVANAVVYKPLVAYVDRRLQAFGDIRGSPFNSLRWQKSFTSLWWHTWIVVYKPLVAYGDRRLKAFGGKCSGLQAFGGRGSRITGFVGKRGSLFTSL